ncbi:DUF982 domain-containing protein [Rhizobium sp. CC-YZS058]|uniref:DUF982 domain-containing protein n=1 Tax=Rhizobium sp. CC-YZS058 TaxID=3042153 RepID=UPI002B05A443|nr:DUF982 domain-containing protein [Rhizobium sp. CC-YZS058]MEA3534402.1 DUF982 domain-containing protein [Rhizobium sp. CC-YZS058]
MSDKRFLRPVRIILEAGKDFIVATAFEAVEFIRRLSGGAMLKAFRIALQHCLDALDGLLSPKRARASFVAALERAGMTAEDVATAKA